MSECRHMGQARLDTAAWCAVERKAIVTCLECGEVIPKGHFRKMLRELKDRTGMEIRPPRPEINPSGGPHWDYSGYQVDGGYENCGADQT